jgi:plastocyanin
MRLRACLFLSLLPALGCAEATPPPQPRPREVGVVVRDNVFEPEEVTVGVNQSVAWVWEGQSEHSLRFAGSSTTAAAARREGVYARTFDTPGTYGYYCTIHGAETGLSVTGMSGRVVVSP